MSKLDQRRKSSGGSKKSLSDSNRLNSSTSYRDFSVSTLEEKPKINYQDELVLLFYDSMLGDIVDKWITIPDVPPKICSCKDKSKSPRSSKDTKASEEKEDAEPQGSTMSLTTGKSRKRSRDVERERKRAKSGEQGKSAESVLQQSRISLKRHSKELESKKSRGSAITISESQLQPDWLVNPPDENVVIFFKNGSRYEGPVVKKVMHGHGKFMWSDGTIYQGDFVNGFATGHGVLQYPGLTTYHGGFCKSLLHGEGVLNISSTTMLYSGNWKCGEKHGRGWLLYESGNWYNGEWHEDQRQGTGVRQYPNGARYQGKWFQGKRDGQGTLYWPNDDFYRGCWKNGNMDGYGEYTWEAFLNKTFTFPVENTYHGSWTNGKRDGVGILNFGTDTGAQLAGLWEQNKKHGAGVVVCGNGQVIERNPLFWADKPIHLDIEVDPGYPKTQFVQDSKQSTASLASLPLKENKSTFQLIADQVRSKHATSAIESQALVKIQKSQEGKDKSQSDFLSGRTECSPLSIPIHSAPEKTDFSYCIHKAVNQYTLQLYGWELGSGSSDNTSDVVRTDLYASSLLKYSKWNVNHQTAISKSLKPPSLPSTIDLQSKLVNFQQSQTLIESKYLRDVIITNLPGLYYLYYKYAGITVPHNLSFKPILVRYFLWQMLRDFKLVNRRYSLIDWDIILMEDPDCGFDSEHYPFEKIYFWQFLHVLVTLAWVLHSPSYVTDRCKNFGILSVIFTKFLDNVAFKNTEHTPSRSLFEFRDVLPINSVYLLYRSLGEPHTARKFLTSTCVKKRESPHCYLKLFEDEETPKPPKGNNIVSVGGLVMYLPEDPPGIGEPPTPPALDPPRDDPFRKSLFILRSLGPKKVVECLASACPPIVEEGVVVNLEYPLTFIEFYDTYLSCGFAVIDRRKKIELRARMREEQKEKEMLEVEFKSKSVSSQKLARRKSKK